MKINRAITIITFVTLFNLQGCNSIYSYKTTYNYYSKKGKDIKSLCDYQVKRIEQRGKLFLVNYHKDTCCINSTRVIYLTFKKEPSGLKLYNGFDYFLTNDGFDSNCYNIIKNETTKVLDFLDMRNITYYEIEEDWIYLPHRLCYYIGGESSEIDNNLYFHINGKYYYKYHSSEVNNDRVKKKIHNWRNPN